MGMFTLSSQMVIEAPADTVWRIVAHRFDRIGDWAAAIDSSIAVTRGAGVVEAPVAGRVCRTGIRAVPEVTETVVEYDEAARTLTYEATDGVPGFVALARNRWHVTALDGGRCLVAFVATVQVRGLVGQLARWWLLLRANRMGRQLFADLEHYVERGTPSPRKQRRTAAPAARRLRAALRANAAFSLASGAVLMAAGWFLAEPWRLGPDWLPPAVGLAVAGFGLLTAWLTGRPRQLLRSGAVLVTAADLAWVAGSAALLAWRPPPPLGAVATAAVAAFAVRQVAALAASRHAVDLPVASSR
jgi:hypothetical protein